MAFIIITIVIVAIFLIIAFKVNNNKEQTSIDEKSQIDPLLAAKSIMENFKKNLPADCFQYIGEGFKQFDIAGIYYQDLEDEDYGDFVGIAIPELTNPYDKYAIRICKLLENGNFRQLGYIPAKQSKEVYTYIMKYGILNANNTKATYAYGTIWKDYEDDTYADDFPSYGAVNLYYKKLL